MDDAMLRENLVELLNGGQAHVTIDDALKDLKPENRHVRAAPELRSIWEELDHMRIAQEDILHYAIDSSYKTLSFPDEYWPPETAKLTDETWKATVDRFNRDLQALIKLAQDPETDLTARIPHGEWRTYLREILLAADHNAYHVAQIVQTRKLLGNWPS
jgi:uncharacterized damage-inducible protein DinB